MDDTTCRHCGQPIRRHAGRSADHWAHIVGSSVLNRCQEPGRPYGYEAAPDDGEPCKCWACAKFGPTSPCDNTRGGSDG